MAIPEKKALTDYNRDLIYMTMGGSNIKTIVYQLKFNNWSVMKKHPTETNDVEYCRSILWLINQPDMLISMKSV